MSSKYKSKVTIQLRTSRYLISNIIFLFSIQIHEVFYLQLHKSRLLRVPLHHTKTAKKPQIRFSIIYLFKIQKTEHPS